jgi:hypothetical protein
LDLRVFIDWRFSEIEYQRFSEIGSFQRLKDFKDYRFSEIRSFQTMDLKGFQRLEVF